VNGRRPTWGEVRRFCESQQFAKRETDHTFFDKTFWNGETAGTKISRGVDGETLTKERWTLVWKRQLRLKSEDDFWRGLEAGTVEYDIPSPPSIAEPLPRYLQHFLATVHHMEANAIAAISQDEAMRLWYAHLARQREPS
jgi:hypothetical protein